MKKLIFALLLAGSVLSVRADAFSLNITSSAGVMSTNGNIWQTGTNLINVPCRLTSLVLQNMNDTTNAVVYLFDGLATNGVQYGQGQNSVTNTGGYMTYFQYLTNRAVTITNYNGGTNSFWVSNQVVTHYLTNPPGQTYFKQLYAITVPSNTLALTVALPTGGLELGLGLNAFVTNVLTIYKPDTSVTISGTYSPSK